MQSVFEGGGGVEFGLTETCFPSLSSGQKHKLKYIGSQYLHVATAVSYYFEQCSKTNHIAIKGVIK